MPKEKVLDLETLRVQAETVAHFCHFMLAATDNEDIQTLFRILYEFQMCGGADISAWNTPEGFLDTVGKTLFERFGLRVESFTLLVMDKARLES